MSYDCIQITDRDGNEWLFPYEGPSSLDATR